MVECQCKYVKELFFHLTFASYKVLRYCGTSLNDLLKLETSKSVTLKARKDKCSYNHGQNNIWN